MRCCSRYSRLCTNCFRPARELVQDLVHLAAALQQPAGEAGQPAALAAAQGAGEVPAQHRLQGRLQLAALLRVREQAPEGAEGLAGVAVGDEVDIGEDRVEHLAAAAVAVDDALAQVPVQAAEVVAHAAEVAGQLVAQGQDLAGTLQGPVRRQRCHAAGAHRGDAGIDALALAQQPLGADLGVRFGLLCELHQLTDHQAEPALGGDAALGRQVAREADSLRCGGAGLVFLLSLRRQAALQPARC
jgi:hypothetical protein